MAPNNWEEQIKQGLQGREIQPSAQAWDRLDAMLTVAEEKKTKRPFGVYFRYMAVAASVLVLLSLGFYFTSNLSEPEVNTPTEVTQKEESEPQRQPEGTTVNALPIGTPAQTQAVAVQPAATKRPANHEKSAAVSPKKRIINPKVIPTTESYTATAVPVPQTGVQNQPVNPQNTTGVIPKTAVAVVQPQLAKTNIKVDASSLLNQVDGELNQSFRERMFDRLNRNYQSAKSALATRNQE